MVASFYNKKHILMTRVCSLLVAMLFGFNTILSSTLLYAQNVANLPAPGTMVTLSPAFTPVLLKGVKPNPKNPFEFDFIVDGGTQKLNLDSKALKDESLKMVKYFLASLTIPEGEQWVNLSPYERNRIAPKSLGMTEMGRDLLAQDYILKQITASLMHPDGETGKKFWEEIYKKVNSEYGVTDIPTDTFNKVWIVPERAVVYEHDGAAFVVESKLKVMLEEDYEAFKTSAESRASARDLAASQFSIGHPDSGLLSSRAQTRDPGSKNGLLDSRFRGNDRCSSILKEIILPAIEKEVNSGENFSQLRQIYQSMILATWYKKRLKEGFLAKIYVDKNKILGVDVEDKSSKEKIYDQYLEAFKKGVYNVIKEEYDSSRQEIIPKKYFSGGTVGVTQKDLALITDHNQLSLNQSASLPASDNGFRLKVVLNNAKSDKAMMSLFTFGKSKATDWIKELGLTRKDLEPKANQLDKVTNLQDVVQSMSRQLAYYNYSVELKGFIINPNEDNKKLTHIAYPSQPMIGVPEGNAEFIRGDEEVIYGPVFAVNESGQLGLLFCPWVTFPELKILHERQIFVTPDKFLLGKHSLGHLLPEKALAKFFPGKTAEELTAQEITDLVLKEGDKDIKTNVFKGEGKSKVTALYIPLLHGEVGTVLKSVHQPQFLFKVLTDDQATFAKTKFAARIHNHTERKDLIYGGLLENLYQVFGEATFLSLNSPGDIKTSWESLPVNKSVMKDYMGEEIPLYIPMSMVVAYRFNGAFLGSSIFSPHYVAANWGKERLNDFITITNRAKEALGKAPMDFDVIKDYYQQALDLSLINKLPDNIGDKAMMALFNFGKKSTDWIKELGLTRKDLEPKANQLDKVTNLQDVVQSMSRQLAYYNYGIEVQSFLINPNQDNKRLTHIAYPSQPMIGIPEGKAEFIGIDEAPVFGPVFAVNEAGQLGLLFCPWATFPELKIFHERQIFVPMDKILLGKHSLGHLLLDKVLAKFFPGKTAENITAQEITDLVLKEGEKDVKTPVFKEDGKSKVTALYIPLLHGEIGTILKSVRQPQFVFKVLSDDQATYAKTKLAAQIHNHTERKDLIYGGLLENLYRTFGEATFLSLNSPGDVLLSWRSLSVNGSLIKDYMGENNNLYIPMSVVLAYRFDGSFLGSSIFSMHHIANKYSEQRLNDFIDIAKTAKEALGKSPIDLDIMKQYYQQALDLSLINKLPDNIGDKAMAVEKDKTAAMEAPGGIDLNSKSLDLEIKTDKGRPSVSFSSAPILDFHIEGLAPVIVHIEAITPVQLPLLLGFIPNSQKQQNGQPVQISQVAITVEKRVY
ncbi:MAG: hypothetical protein HQL24_05095 [Candidatus Omnitrophica bacterium]|nr:hypothetical protein [Candidatus Omnitrophota bacterium]